METLGNIAREGGIETPPWPLCSLHWIPGWVLCLSELVKDSQRGPAAALDHKASWDSAGVPAAGCLDGHTSNRQLLAMAGWHQVCRVGVRHPESGTECSPAAAGACVTQARATLGREQEGRLGLAPAVPCQQLGHCSPLGPARLGDCTTATGSSQRPAPHSLSVCLSLQCPSTHRWQGVQQGCSNLLNR